MGRALVALLLVACTVETPSPDAGYSSDVSACCWKVPLGDEAVSACIAEQCAEGECRWLSCLGGLLHYEACSYDVP